MEEAISPDFLVRHWPPALEEWSTKAVRDAFFASPKFPRLLNPEVLKETIARGVREGKFGYASKGYGGTPERVRIDDPGFVAEEVEFSEDVILIPAEKARALRRNLRRRNRTMTPPKDGEKLVRPIPRPVACQRLSWEGDLPPQKWSQFYMKVLTHFATDPSLRLRVRFEVAPEEGIPLNRRGRDLRQACASLTLTQVDALETILRECARQDKPLRRVDAPQDKLQRRCVRKSTRKRLRRCAAPSLSPSSPVSISASP